MKENESCKDFKFGKIYNVDDTNSLLVLANLCSDYADYPVYIETKVRGKFGSSIGVRNPLHSVVVNKSTDVPKRIYLETTGKGKRMETVNHPNSSNVTLREIFEFIGLDEVKKDIINEKFFENTSEPVHLPITLLCNKEGKNRTKLFSAGPLCTIIVVDNNPESKVEGRIVLKHS